VTFHSFCEVQSGILEHKMFNKNNRRILGQNDRTLLRRHIALFVVFATIFQFSGFGAVFFADIGFTRPAGNFKIHEAQAAG
jgi:hypothetical protein